MSDRNILIFGPTGSGKTAQLGELAWDDYKRTGKVTRLYTRDLGGYATVEAEVRAGIIDPVLLDGQNPWALEDAVRGLVPDTARPGYWVRDPERDAKTGFCSFESIASWAQTQMLDLSDRAAGNGRPIENVGGKSPIRFAAGLPGSPDGARFIGSNNESHYGIVQGNIRTLVWKSFNLPFEGVTWTSLDVRGEDKESGSPIVAPLLVGKAGVENIPSWFHQTFHLIVEPAEGGKPAVHKLFLEPHRDMTVGGMSYGLANSRQPLGTTPLPSFIVPASVPEALRLLGGLVETKEAKLKAEKAAVDAARR